MLLHAGAEIGAYEIVGPLGAGAMGEVYRARDRKLGRDVAIKVVRGADRERLRRFEQEARAASALNHPNIVTIYEVGEHEGTPYIAMELVEGRTLRQLLRRGPLGAAELIRYAAQIAEGLAKAHEAGIVHRDLKPENVIINEDGYLKILDFGLAKLLPKGNVGAEAPTLTKGTEPGAILGTAGYLSPEQAKGEPADFRSDQFSLGAILYEMATGKRAFERESAAETLTAIIREEPDPMTLANPKVSPALADVVHRCLGKNPGDRFPSTQEIARTLHAETLKPPAASTDRRSLLLVAAVAIFFVLLILLLSVFVSEVGERASAPEIDSIAVLPLDNLSGDPAQEYFADGMTDALIGKLGQLEALTVISRTSAMRYKGADAPLPEIAEELGVQALVEGSVLTAGDRVRVSVSLVEAATDASIWSESYERDTRDILALQSEVAESVARAIDVQVSGEERALLEASHPIDEDAYRALTRGQFFARHRTEEALRRGIGYIEEAIAIDPTYAEAHAALADAYMALGFALASPLETTPKARAAAIKALELNDTLPAAHKALASIRFNHDRAWTLAEQSFERALELNPNYAEAWREYGELKAALGDLEESLALHRRAWTIEPDPMAISDVTAWHYYLSRDFENALEPARAALEMDPERLPSQWTRFRILKELGELDAAVQAYATSIRTHAPPERVQAADLLESTYQTSGYAEAMRTVASFIEDRRDARYVSPYATSILYVDGEDLASAMRWLEIGYDNHDTQLHWVNVDPAFDPLRPDPRFQDLLRRMGFAG